MEFKELESSGRQVDGGIQPAIFEPLKRITSDLFHKKIMLKLFEVYAGIIFSNGERPSKLKRPPGVVGQLGTCAGTGHSPPQKGSRHNHPFPRSGRHELRYSNCDAIQYNCNTDCWLLRRGCIETVAWRPSPFVLRWRGGTRPPPL